MSKAIRSRAGRAALPADIVGVNRADAAAIMVLASGGTSAEAIETSQADAAPVHSTATIQQGMGAIGAPLAGVSTPRPAPWWVDGQTDRTVSPRPAVASRPSSAMWTLLR